MANQIITSFWTQWQTAGTVMNSLFPTSTFDDSVIWDDSKIWIDNPTGTQVFSRRLI